MPRKRPSKILMESYLENCQKRQLGEGTIRNYRNTIERGLSILNHKNPSRINEDDISDLLKKWRTKPQSVRVFNLYLMYCENYTLKNMRLRFPRSEPRRTWLTKEQAELLVASCETPKERMIIHLELELGLRKIEVLRSRLSDFQNDILLVRGKGRMGGKIRMVPTHKPLTRLILNDWIMERNELVSETNKDSEYLLVYKMGRQLRNYSQTGLEPTFKRLKQRVGFHFSHHTLRRTFARELDRNNVSIRDIRDLLGHETLDQTEKYIGKSFESMEKGLQTLKFQKVYPIQMSQSGQS